MQLIRSFLCTRNISSHSSSQRFLYSPFPVESCLRGRLCDNLNAEIAGGTVKSLLDCVGYLTWTFFARRVKANPSYYGASSSDTAEVERFLLDVAKETVQQLAEEKCVLIEGDMDAVDCALFSTSLGAAGSDFYLVYQSPKQMQFGLQECAKLIIRERSSDVGRDYSTSKLVPMHVPKRIDEITISWLLYTLSCTHQFDELPVRHNEEILNEELSNNLIWGPNTDKVQSISGRSAYIDPDVYADPHTK